MDEQEHHHHHKQVHNEGAHPPKVAVRFDLDSDYKVTNFEVNGIKYAVFDDAKNRASEQSVIDIGHETKDSADDLMKAQVVGKRLLLAQTRNGLLTIFMLAAVEILAEVLWFREDPDLFEQFGWWIFYLDVSVVSLVVMIGYLRSYRYASANHMISMMIGMTVGMQVGMMTGGVIGATDGYFMGAIVGVGLGTMLGVSTAWCCGPMAITQALMSAVMGGTMGSMIVAMMPPEKLLVFMPIFTLLNIAILIWFSFLFFKDCVIGERCRIGRVVPFWATFFISLLIVSGLGGLMVVNPGHAKHFKSPDEGMAGAGGNPFETKEIRKVGEQIPHTKEMTCGAGMSGDESKQN